MSGLKELEDGCRGPSGGRGGNEGGQGEDSGGRCWGRRERGAVGEKTRGDIGEGEDSRKRGAIGEGKENHVVFL